MRINTVSSVLNAGKSYQYVDDGEPIRGNAKEVYFSPDKSYVVAFYRDVQEPESKERLKQIVTQYGDDILKTESGAYFRAIFCWPLDIVEEGKKTGLVLPAFREPFFFKKGYAAGEDLLNKEKRGSFFAGAEFRSPHSPLRLHAGETGTWLSYFQICIKIARGVNRLHAAGLAHSALSPENILLDPLTRTVLIAGIDSLVVPRTLPPDKAGSDGFIAPEILATNHLSFTDAARKGADLFTDLHSLAVTIYVLLLHRHPLKGGKTHSPDSALNELMTLGEAALFIEHPADPANRPDPKRSNPAELPWVDVTKLPYTIAGPYLKPLFDRAFVDGLHQPARRPTAADWEGALLNTTDLLLPCSNPACDQKWYVFDNSRTPDCPFCGTRYMETLPILEFYVQHAPGQWRAEGRRLMIYRHQHLFCWHVDRNVVRDEKLSDVQKAPAGYFAFHHGKWVFVNQTLDTLKDLTDNVAIPAGTTVRLTNGKRLLLSKEDGGRVAIVTMVTT